MIPHLKYFLAIEDELINCSKYVEFNSNNYSTYSIEFAKLIMTSSSEIDSVFKELCKAISPTSNPKNITEYYPIIIGKYPKFTEIEIEVFKYNISFKPWENWNDTVRPSWWRGYNEIKHERELNFEKANLENTLYSIGALFALLLYLGIEKSGPINYVEVNAFEAPRTFKTKDRSSGFSSSGIVVVYDLPDFR